MFEETLEKPWHIRLFGPIEDAADAEYITSGLGVALVAIGTLGAIAVFKFGILALVSGFVYLVLGFLLWRMKSSAAALVLLSLEILDLLVRVALVFRRGGFALIGVLWGFVLLWVGIRAVQATRAYHRLAHAEPVPEADPKHKAAPTF